MALTRKMLTAMEIPAEKIDEIINAHSETVNALKEERDKYKSDTEKLPQIEKDLKSANAKIAEFGEDDTKQKYSELKEKFDNYKKDVEAKASRSAKETAYKKLLADAGIPEKRFGTILKVTNLDEINLDKEGLIKGADKVEESIKSEWSDFIVTQSTKGADTPKPPTSTGGVLKTRDEIMGIKDTAERQAAWAEYLANEQGE